MKDLLSYLLILSLWTLMFSPISSAQVTTSEVRIETSEKSNLASQTPEGLDFRIREGKGSATQAEKGMFSVEELSNVATKNILQRLSELPNEIREPSTKLLPSSIQPPQNALPLNIEFPQDDQNISGIGSNKSELEVLRYSPVGEVPFASEISITFSQPMTSLTADNEATPLIPVTLTPEVKGRWRWLGTTVLKFTPEEKLPIGTKFAARISAGTKSATGGLLQRDLDWTFSVAQPKIVALRGDSNTLGPKTLLAGFFDQRVDAAGVINLITATANGINIPLRLATENEIPEEVIELSQTLPEIAGKFVFFRPVDSFPGNSKVTISYGSNTNPTKELRKDSYQTYVFSSFNEFVVTAAGCRPGSEGDDCPAGFRWSMEFSNDLDDKSFDVSQIQIDPPLVDPTFSVSSNRISFQPHGPINTKYTVTLPPTIKDVFGQSLKSSRSRSFRSVQSEPGFGSTFRESLITLNPNEAPRFPVYSRNVSALKVRLYSVEPEMFESFTNFLRQRNGMAPTFGRLVVEKEIKVDHKVEDLVDTRIDLNPALENGLGHVVLIVESDETKPGDNRIIKWIQSTRIGLDIVGDTDNNIEVFASELLNGKPLEGLEIRALDEKIATTDRMGVARFKINKARVAPQLVIARSSNDSMVWRTRGFGPLDYYNRTIKSSADQFRWLMFNDRQLYRPTEPLAIKGYLRRITGAPESKLLGIGGSANKIDYVWTDWRDREILRGSLDLNDFGAFDLQLTIPADVDLGQHSIEFTANGELDNNKTRLDFFVDEFRRPEFEVVTKVDSSGRHYVGDSVSLSANAAYFSGGKLTDASINWDVQASPTGYTPPNQSEFTFGVSKFGWSSGSLQTGSRSRQTLDGVTDSSGTGYAILELIKSAHPTPFLIQAAASIRDVNKQVVENRETLIVHPSSFYVGLNSDRSFVNPNETIRGQTIVTDVEGKPVEGVRLEMVAELKQRKTIDGKARLVTVESKKCVLSSGEKLETCGFTSSQAGLVSVRADVRDPQGRLNRTEIPVLIAGGLIEPPSNDIEDSIQLVPDKSLYSPGETAEILVSSRFHPAEGQIILSRNGLVKTERFRLEGASQTIKVPIDEAYVPNIHVGVSLSGVTSPTVFNDDRDSHFKKTPVFAEKSLNLPVSIKSRSLTVTTELQTLEERPGKKTKVSVVVKDSSGKPAESTEVVLVAVDEAVLSVLNYHLPNPLDAFYSTLDSKMAVSSSRNEIATDYLEVAGSLNLSANELSKFPDLQRARIDAIASTRSKSATESTNGGIDFSLYGIGKSQNKSLFVLTDPLNDKSSKQDKSNAPPNQIRIRRNFAALAAFVPSVKTDATGRANIEFTLPDNLTRYRITALAASKSNHFGSSETTLTVKQGLMIRPSAPRFMNFGDTAEMPVILQNHTDSPMQVDLAWRSNSVVLTETNGRRVTIPGNERSEIRVRVKAEKPGVARLQIGAATVGHSDAAEIEFPVYTPSSTEVFATYGSTEQNGAIFQPITAPKDAFDEIGGLEVTTSSTRLQELTDAFIYLQNYPYDCSEQIASRVLSAIPLRDLLERLNAPELPSRDEINAKLASDIERLSKLQHRDGGFSFWRNEGESFPFVGIHVAHALARAKTIGFKVPDVTVEKAHAYVSKIEESVLSKSYSQEARLSLIAYSYYVRHLLGDEKAVVLSKEFLTKNALDHLNPEAAAWILAVLASDDNSVSQIENIVRFLSNRVTETADRANFVTKYEDGEYVLLSSDSRADGVILEALLQLDNVDENGPIRATTPLHQLVPKIVRGLLVSRNNGRWSNTQENAFVILALAKYFEKFESQSPDFVSNIWFGKRFAGKQTFVGRSASTNHVNIPIDQLRTPERVQNLLINKQGLGRLYYRIALKFAPRSLQVDSADEGFAVNRFYESVDNPSDVERKEDGSWKIKAGSRVRVRIEITNTNNRYHVALADYLPAGLEIINPDLRISDYRNLGDSPLGGPGFWFNHQNLRDNRAEAFTEVLNSGTYQYSYVCRATTTGSFVAPPAKAEEMYSPETFGRSSTDLVRIE